MNAPDWKTKPPFSLVREAAGLIKGRQRTLSENSIRGYLATGARMIRTHRTPIDFASTKGSYFYHRASWVYWHIDQMDNIVRRARSSETKSQGFEAVGDALSALQPHLDALKEYAPDPEGWHCRTGIQSQWTQKRAEMQRLGKSLRPHSKKRLTRHYPANWRDQILQRALSIGTPHAAAIAVLSLTGCRPEELNTSDLQGIRGVRITLLDGGRLNVSISGAKTHGQKYGQLWRRFTIQEDSLAFRYLQEKSAAAGGALVIADTARPLCSCIDRIAKALWPRKRRRRPSAISFRHAMASDLKSLGYNRGDISRVLGHCDEATARYYSPARTGGGGRTITDVDSAREPKPVPSVDLSCFSTSDTQIDSDRSSG
jgi:integrase